MVDERNEAEHRGDHEAGAEADKDAAAPDEDRHVRRQRHDQLAGGAQGRAEAEVGAPADDGAHQAARYHEGAGHQRVHHVRQLDVGGRRTEHVDQLLVGEAERAIVARRSHLRQNQHDNGQHEELLNTPLGMRRFALRHYVLL